MPKYAPTEPFIEEFNRVQQRNQIYEDFANRKRALAVQRNNARNWQSWLRINRSRDLGLNEQAYRQNAKRVYSVTNREFLLREWNIHRNRKIYGNTLEARRQAESDRNAARAKNVEASEFLAIQRRMQNQRAVEAWKDEQRARALAMRQVASAQVFATNRAIFEAKSVPPPAPPMNSQGQRIAPIDPEEQAQYAAALARLEENRRARGLVADSVNPLRTQRETADRAAFADLQQRIREAVARQRAAASDFNRQRALQVLQRQQALGFGPAQAQSQTQGQAAPPVQGAEQAPVVINVVPPVQQQVGP